VFADSAVITTAMLKKCVRVPIRNVKNPYDRENAYNMDPSAVT